MPFSVYVKVPLNVELSVYQARLIPETEVSESVVISGSAHEKIVAARSTSVAK